jgi:hypothetical protein
MRCSEPGHRAPVAIYASPRARVAELGPVAHFEGIVKYHLHYKESVIATVEDVEADFPTFFGHYELAPTVSTPALAHIQAYIDYSVRVWPLIEQDRCDEIDLAEEQAFTDLIESSDWILVEAVTANRIPILIPVFCTDNGINWRLNPSVQQMRRNLASDAEIDEVNLTRLAGASGRCAFSVAQAAISPI